MQARRAARELALILFSQFDKNITEYSEKDFEEIMLKSVRLLSNNSSEELKTAVGTLIDMKDYVLGKFNGLELSIIKKNFDSLSNFVSDYVTLNRDMLIQKYNSMDYNNS